MDSVGIRELKQRTSEIVRQVREDGQGIDITYRGRVVARIVAPESPEAVRDRSRQTWDRLDELAKQVSAAWPDGVSAVEAVREQRRDL